MITAVFLTAVFYISAMNEKDFIPGIYNHCDRWCERCDFTQHCRLYYDERKQYNASEDKDDFMAIVSQNLDKALNMLQEIAEERGIDLDDIDDEDFEKEQQKEKEIEKHLLTKKALKYTIDVDKWLKTNNHLESLKKEYLNNIDLGIETDKSDKALRMLEEALNIIQWYQFQIQVKLSSALRYYPHNSDFEDELQNMYHSSAKIACIGIENSMRAWQRLLELKHNHEDFILDMLLQLTQLKALTHKQFPLLKQYKRPVFDD